MRLVVPFPRSHLNRTKVYTLSRSKFRVNRGKILNSPVWTKCPVKIFSWSKIRPVSCEHSLHLAYFLGLITPRDLSVSGHVVQALPRIRHRSELTESDWKNADQGLGKPASSLGRTNLTLITLPWTIRQVISAKTLYDKNLSKNWEANRTKPNTRQTWRSNGLPWMDFPRACMVIWCSPLETGLKEAV